MAAPPPSPAAKPTAKPASPAPHAAAIAICPQLDMLSPWWQHEAFPGCPAPPFVFSGSLNEVAGGICAAGTDCGRPCSVSYEAFSGSIAWSVSVRYDARGRWLGLPDGGSMYGAIACSYDGERLASCTQHNSDGKLASNLVARRDDTGRLIALEDTVVAPGEVWKLTLTYNAHGDVSAEQLTTTSTNRRVVFDYDAASHRLLGERRDELPPPPGTGKPAAGKQSAKPAPSPRVRYSYDAGVLSTRTSENMFGRGTDRTTYHFTDGALVESKYREHGTPFDVERETVSYDDRGRPRQLDWDITVKGQRYDNMDRSLNYHYADDPDDANACKP
jgi:hypothetical protein